MAKTKKWLECFIPHRLEVLTSPAWRERPVPLMRMLERLELEHLRHGGQQNGELYVSYGQFIEAGISRRVINPTATLGEALGLIEVLQSPERSNGTIRPPNAYRLTYIPERGKRVPTDEWKSVSEQLVTTSLERYRKSVTGQDRSIPKCNAEQCKQN